MSLYKIWNKFFLVLIIGSLFVGIIFAQEPSKAAPIKKAPAPLTEMEKQQKILEQYKPLIKPRSYKELVVYKDTAAPLVLNRLPQLEEAIIPGRAPNILLIPYLLKSYAHPAYAANFNYVNYFIAVNCEDPKGFDDCSTIPHNRFAGEKVYVKFIQSSDVNFNLVKGMRVGQSFSEVQHLFTSNTEIHGDGECLKASAEWLACFDASTMAVNKQRLQMMPAKNAKLLRFLKIKGKAY